MHDPVIWSDEGILLRFNVHRSLTEIIHLWTLLRLNNGRHLFFVALHGMQEGAAAEARLSFVRFIRYWPAEVGRCLTIVFR